MSCGTIAPPVIASGSVDRVCLRSGRMVTYNVTRQMTDNRSDTWPEWSTSFGGCYEQPARPTGARRLSHTPPSRALAGRTWNPMASVGMSRRHGPSRYVPTKGNASSEHGCQMRQERSHILLLRCDTSPTALETLGPAIDPACMIEGDRAPRTAVRGKEWLCRQRRRGTKALLFSAGSRCVGMSKS